MILVCSSSLVCIGPVAQKITSSLSFIPFSLMLPPGYKIFPLATAWHLAFPNIVLSTSFTPPDFSCSLSNSHFRHHFFKVPLGKPYRMVSPWAPYISLFIAHIHSTVNPGLSFGSCQPVATVVPGLHPFLAPPYPLNLPPIRCSILSCWKNCMTPKFLPIWIVHCPCFLAVSPNFIFYTFKYYSFYDNLFFSSWQTMRS